MCYVELEALVTQGAVRCSLCPPIPHRFVGGEDIGTDCQVDEAGRVLWARGGREVGWGVRQPLGARPEGHCCPSEELGFSSLDPRQKRGPHVVSFPRPQHPPSPARSPCCPGRGLRPGLPPGACVCLMSWQHECWVSACSVCSGCAQALHRGRVGRWAKNRQSGEPCRTCCGSQHLLCLDLACSPPPPLPGSSFCARAGWGRAALSGGPSGRHGLLVLGPVVICGFLCRIPMEPGARQSAAFWRK